MAQSREDHDRESRAFIRAETERRMNLMNQSLDQEVAKAIAQAMFPPASLQEWQADGHERGQAYVDTGVCSCPRCVEATRTPQGDGGPRSPESRPSSHAAQVLARCDALVRQRRWREGDAWSALLGGASMWREAVWAITPWPVRDQVAGGTCPDYGASDRERMEGMPVIFMVDK